MRQTTTVQVMREQVETILLVCDICGRQGSTVRDWGSGAFDATETTVELVEGSRYPEGGAGTKRTIDICPTCFKEKLIPWVEGHGKTSIEEEEWCY